MNTAVYAPLDALIDEYMNAHEGGVRRLLHGRSGRHPQLSWLNLDAFNRTVLLRCYRAPDAGFVQWLLAAQMRLAGRGVRTLCQFRDRIGAPYLDAATNDTPAPCTVVEAGLRFELRFVTQNNGLFLDAAPARAWVRAQARGLRVLNLFAYTCGFSVAALAGGALHCTNVDISGSALAWGRVNHRLNGFDSSTGYHALDILKSWGRLKKAGPYDLIVVDPPSYQKGSFVAQTDYRKLLRRLPELASPEALILLCLNAPELPVEFLHGLAAELCPNWRFTTRLPLPQAYAGDDADRLPKFLVYQPAA